MKTSKTKNQMNESSKGNFLLGRYQNYDLQSYFLGWEESVKNLGKLNSKKIKGSF
ncbi:MAG: hypothetical protein ACJ75J_18030 [Cytophagaceae bacterium]|jgi:hypothetical protein